MVGPFRRFRRTSRGRFRGRRSGRGRGFRVRGFRRAGVQRLFRRRRVYRRRSRRYGRGGKARLNRFTAIINTSIPGITSDLGLGGAVRTFVLIGTRDSATPSQNVYGGTPPTGISPTWTSYWRQPLFISVRDARTALSIGSTAIDPIATYNINGGQTFVSNAYNCGFSSNITYSLDDIAMSNYMEFSKLYREMRVRRVIHKWWAYRVNRVAAAGVDENAQFPLANWDASRPNCVPRNARGGDMVWMCTRYTGPVDDLQSSTAQIGNGEWLNNTGYSRIKRSPQFRKRCQLRNDVAYGMRPVTFKFAPTMLVPDRRVSTYNSLYSTAVDGTNIALMGTVSGPAGGVNPIVGNGAAWRYKRMPWIPTLVPYSIGVSSLTSNGGLGATAGNVTDVSSGYVSRTNRWMSIPLFGMFMGMQPQTTMVWPQNIRQSWAYQLEFRKPRLLTNLASTGDVNGPRYRDWGYVPTLTDTTSL